MGRGERTGRPFFSGQLVSRKNRTSRIDRHMCYNRLKLIFCLTEFAKKTITLLKK